MKVNVSFISLDPHVADILVEHSSQASELTPDL